MFYLYTQIISSEHAIEPLPRHGLFLSTLLALTHRYLPFSFPLTPDASMSVPVPVRSFSSLEGIHRVRPQSVKLEYNRPKPSLAKSDPAVTDENLDDINQASLHDAQLSYSAECPLRRSTEVPVAPRPTRSMSLTSVVRPPSPQEDEYPLKLVTIPNKSPRCISAEQVRLILLFNVRSDLEESLVTPFFRVRSVGPAND